MNRLLVALALASALAPLGSTAVAVALPRIAQATGEPQGSLTQWLVTSYLLVAIVLQGPGGSLADRWGARRALAIGQTLVAVGAVFGAVGAHLSLLVLSRVLSAAGGALIGPSAVAMMRTTLPPERHGRALALFGMTMGLAAAAGPPLSGELVMRFGWRASFLLGAPLLLVSVVLGRDTAPAAVDAAVAPRRRPHPFDLPGSVLLGVSLVLLVGGVRVGRPLLVLASLVTLALFVAWERRAPAPLVELALFRRAAFTAGGLVVALQNLAMYALLFELPQFFMNVRGVEADRSGRLLMALTLGSVGCAPLGARLAERFGARAVAVPGSLVGVAGVWLLRDPAALVRPADALPGLLLLGAALGLCSAPSQTAALAVVDPARTGAAAGMLSVLRYLGGVAGLAVLGAFSRGDRPAEVSFRHAASLRVFLVTLACAALLAGLLPSTRVTRRA